jgi:hypothetical protein
LIIPALAAASTTFCEPKNPVDPSTTTILR